MDLPRWVYEMYEKIGSPRTFRAALAAGERLLSLYQKNQVGADVEMVPNLCRYFDIGKTKLHKILHCQKYEKDKPDVMHNASSCERRGEDRRASSEESQGWKVNQGSSKGDNSKEVNQKET